MAALNPQRHLEHAVVNPGTLGSVPVVLPFSKMSYEQNQGIAFEAGCPPPFFLT